MSHQSKPVCSHSYTWQYLKSCIGVTWSSLFCTPHRKTSMGVKPGYLQVHALQESFIHKSQDNQGTHNFNLWDCGQFQDMRVTSPGAGAFDKVPMTSSCAWAHRTFMSWREFSCSVHEDFSNFTRTQTSYLSMLFRERRQRTSSTLCVTWHKQNLEVLRDVPLRVAVHIEFCLHQISKPEQHIKHDGSRHAELSVCSLDGISQAETKASLTDLTWHSDLLLYAAGCFELFSWGGI
jgi:hypothetical protein